MSGALSYAIVPRSELSAAEEARMLALMHLCYDNVDDAQFARDLAEKSSVIVMRDAYGVLQGFSTIRMADDVVDGRACRIMFSGDTVIHPDHWGTKALQRGFLAFVMREKLRAPRTKLYWLLLSKGYRTYLLLTNNFPISFPRRAYDAPSSLVALRDRVATMWWGAQFDPRSEIVRWTHARDRVKNGIAPVDTALLENDDVAYFLARNPAHATGDELVCLAEVDFGLPLRFGFKQLRRALGFSPRRSTVRA